MNKRLFQPTKQTEPCPQCGSPLVMKKGKKGLFLGCSNYPDCDYLKPLQPHHNTQIIKSLPQRCPQCGHVLQLKQGSYGMFIGCSNYPQCQFVVQEEAPPPEQTIGCPECGQGMLVARRGRQGKLFYGCSRYPKCKFTLPDKPYAVSCPACGGQVCSLKKESETHRTWQCAARGCRHIFDTAL